MARKPKNANIDIRQTARVFDERAFVDGVFNDDYFLVVGSGVILNRKQFPNSKGDINQYIIDEINKDRCEVQTDFIDHKSFTDVCSSFGSVKEMAGSIHTPASCLSKLRSSLEAGKKQLRVWLQYVCGVTEMFLNEPSGRAERLYPSFRVGFNPTFLALGRANVFVLHSLNRKVPLALLLSPYGDSEMAWRRDGDLKDVCASGNMERMANEAGSMDSRTYVHEAMSLFSYFEAMI